MMARCKMCDFRRKDREKIPLPNICGSIFVGDERYDLDFITGEIELEKCTYPLTYSLTVTVTGATSSGDTICTMAKISTTICPNCGRVLKKAECRGKE